jgi:hypothetical protein
MGTACTHSMDTPVAMDALLFTQYSVRTDPKASGWRSGTAEEQGRVSAGAAGRELSRPAGVQRGCRGFSLPASASASQCSRLYGCKTRSCILGEVALQASASPGWQLLQLRVLTRFLNLTSASDMHPGQQHTSLAPSHAVIAVMGLQR